MHILGEEITVTWSIPPNASPPASTVFDIYVVPSTLGGSYTDAGIVNYVAPTATTHGTLEYSFIPVAKGLYRVYLEEGAATGSVVEDEQWFWVFTAAPTLSYCTDVLGAASIGETATLLSDTFFIGDWYSMTGISEDPSDPDTIWITGRAELGDTDASLGKVSKDSKSITNIYPITGAGQLIQGPAAMPDGRIVVNRTNPYSGNEYRNYYSDPPYTTWTACTLVGAGTDFAGAGDNWWDASRELVFWQLGTQLRVSTDGISFYKQYYDHPSAGSQSVGGCEWHKDLGDTLFMGAVAIAGDGERTYYTTGLASTAPIAYTLFLNQDDVYGDGYGSKAIKRATLSLDGTKLIAVSSDGIAAVTATGYDGFTIKDRSADFGNWQPNHIATIPDWDGIFIACFYLSSWKWFQTTDDFDTVIESTDERVINIEPTNNQGSYQSPMRNINGDTGIAAVHRNDVSSYSLAISV